MGVWIEAEKRDIHCRFLKKKDYITCPQKIDFFSNIWPCRILQVIFL